MSFTDLQINNRTLKLRSATIEPKFGDRNVLTANFWDYVSLWLNQSSDAEETLFYWDQARQFYRASIQLDPIASPLTAYYSILNATKAFLKSKNQSFSDNHGVSGDKAEGNVVLKNELVTFKSGGVLAALCAYLNTRPSSTAADETYNLETLLYQLPFIHRAFILTYTSKMELFIPVINPKFVIKENSEEAWFCAEIPNKYINPSLSQVLPDGYEHDEGVEESWIVRKRSRFEWTEEQTTQDIERLTGYHKRVRKDFVPILANKNRWYMMKDVTATKPMDKTIPVVIYAAMHRLSELARYDPTRLKKHLVSRQNWLVSEFIKIAPAQFLLRMASEITGLEFVEPYAARLPDRV